MASNFYHDSSTCSRKEPLTEKEARAVARYARRNKNGLRVDAYRCRVCGHWHVGKRPKNPVKRYKPPGK